MLPYASHRICTMSTLITLEINIYFRGQYRLRRAARFILRHMFSSRLFFLNLPTWIVTTRK